MVETEKLNKLLPNISTGNIMGPKIQNLFK